MRNAYRKGIRCAAAPLYPSLFFTFFCISERLKKAMSSTGRGGERVDVEDMLAVVAGRRTPLTEPEANAGPPAHWTHVTFSKEKQYEVALLGGLVAVKSVLVQFYSEPAAAAAAAVLSEAFVQNARYYSCDIVAAALSNDTRVGKVARDCVANGHEEDVLYLPAAGELEERVALQNGNVTRRMTLANRRRHLYARLPVLLNMIFRSYSSETTLGAQIACLMEPSMEVPATALRAAHCKRKRKRTAPNGASARPLLSRILTIDLMQTLTFHYAEDCSDRHVSEEDIFESSEGGKERVAAFERAYGDRVVVDVAAYEAAAKTVRENLGAELRALVNRWKAAAPCLKKSVIDKHLSSCKYMSFVRCVDFTSPVAVQVWHERKLRDMTREIYHDLVLHQLTLDFSSAALGRSNVTLTEAARHCASIDRYRVLTWQRTAATLRAAAAAEEEVGELEGSQDSGEVEVLGASGEDEARCAQVEESASGCLGSRSVLEEQDSDSDDSSLLAPCLKKRAQ